MCAGEEKAISSKRRRRWPQSSFQYLTIVLNQIMNTLVSRCPNGLFIPPARDGRTWGCIKTQAPWNFHQSWCSLYHSEHPGAGDFTTILLTETRCCSHAMVHSITSDAFPSHLHPDTYTYCCAAGDARCCRLLVEDGTNLWRARGSNPRQEKLCTLMAWDVKHFMVGWQSSRLGWYMREKKKEERGGIGETDLLEKGFAPDYAPFGWFHAAVWVFRQSADKLNPIHGDTSLLAAVCVRLKGKPPLALWLLKAMLLI